MKSPFNDKKAMLVTITASGRYDHSARIWYDTVCTIATSLGTISKVRVARYDLSAKI